MVELVDTQDLGSCAFGCEGSSPSFGTCCRRLVRKYGPHMVLASDKLPFTYSAGEPPALGYLPHRRQRSEPQ